MTESAQTAGSPALFVTTHWSVVLAAKDKSSPDSASALEALCREHLAPYKVPVAFRTIAQLPRNEIGKIRAPDLVALARADD